jgi:alpha-1,3-rhamnosyl/mannosyltransferase
MLLRLGLAAMIITPSEAVKRQAIERFHLPADRVAVVPLAAAASFRPTQASERQLPYLLYVGTLEPRKNVGLVLDLWRELRQQHPVELILAGRRRADFPEILPEPGLHLRDLTPENELPGLYSGAIACLYPSFYEGFGLPVLEAMQCGALMIASSDPSIQEVAGAGGGAAEAGAIVLDIQDRGAWLSALRMAITQPEEMRAWRERAVMRAAKYSWTKTAHLTKAVYEQAIRRFRK